MKRRLTIGQSAVVLMAGGVAAIGAGLWLALGLGVALVAVGVLAVGLSLLVGWQ